MDTRHQEEKGDSDIISYIHIYPFIHNFIQFNLFIMHAPLKALNRSCKLLYSNGKKLRHFNTAKEELKVHINTNSKVATLTLNRPQARNALSTSLLQDLGSAVTSVSEDRNVHVIILEAEGGVFSSGHDLKEVTGDNQNHGTYMDLFQLCSKVMIQIAESEKPIIAKVNGIATAAGCQLVAACDLVVATENSKFATPGVNIGLFCSTPAVSIARAVGRRNAMYMLLTGDLIDAEEAKDFGLVTKIVDTEEKLTSYVDELANKIALKSPASIKMGKRAFNKQIQLGLQDAYELTSATMADNLLDPDATEGINAFLSKRPPVWPSVIDKYDNK